MKALIPLALGGIATAKTMKTFHLDVGDPRLRRRDQRSPCARRARIPLASDPPRAGQTEPADDSPDASGRGSSACASVLNRSGSADGVGHRERHRGRRAHPRDLLDRRGVADGVEPRSAPFLRDHHPQKTQRGHLLDDRRRESPQPLVLRDLRAQLRLDEVADHRPDHGLVLGRGEAMAASAFLAR